MRTRSSPGGFAFLARSGLLAGLLAILAAGLITGLLGLSLLAPAATHAAEIEFRLKTPSLRIGIGKADPQTRPDRSHPRRDRPASHRRHRPRRQVLYVPYRVRETSRPAVPTDPAPTLPDRPVAETEAPAPPSPRAAAGIYQARGRVQHVFAVGDALPPTLPHVTQHAGRYDLPPPPPNEIYARVRAQVLRITATTRVVTADVTP